MDRAEYLLEYCENKKCDNPDCDNCMYEKGRADATKELPTSLYCDGFNDGYPKGKSDAIDELETELIDIILGNEEFTTWQKLEISLCLECAIEQLKEKNNE